MTRKQNDFIRMADAVLTLLDQHERDWMSNIPFKKNVEALRTARALASDAGVGQRARSNGLTQDKDDLADAAIAQVLRLRGFAQAYALDGDDTVLYDSLRVSATALDRMTDSELQDALNDLSQRIHALPKAAVRPYGITEASLRAMVAAIDAHKEALGTPRAAISERKVHTDAAAESISELRAVFRKLDRQVPVFDEDAPEFVSAYRSARNVIPSGRGGSDGTEVPKG